MVSLYRAAATVRYVENRAARAKTKRRAAIRFVCRMAGRSLGALRLMWLLVSGVFWRWPHRGWRALTRRPTGFGEGLPERRRTMRRLRRESRRQAAAQ